MGARVLVELEEHGQGTAGLGVSPVRDGEVLAQPRGVRRVRFAAVSEHDGAGREEDMGGLVDDAIGLVDRAPPRHGEAPGALELAVQVRDVQASCLVSQVGRPRSTRKAPSEGQEHT